MFQNALRNVTCERPPRPRLFGTGPFLDGAATPPFARRGICPLEPVNEFANCSVCAHSPPREEGWLRHHKKSRSHRSAADGVVAHTQMFQNASRNVTCERPPRPRLFGTGPFLDGAA